MTQPVVETKVAGREVTPGDAASTERLNRYWTEGAGAAKIRWGVPGDFDRCVALMSKYMHDDHMVKGHCANLHKRATGARPGHAPGIESAEAAAKHAESRAGKSLDLDDLLETKSLDPSETPLIISRLDLGDGQGTLLFGVDGSLFHRPVDAAKVLTVHGPVDVDADVVDNLDLFVTETKDAREATAGTTEPEPEPGEPVASGTDLPGEATEKSMERGEAAAAADEDYPTGDDGDDDPDYDPEADPEPEDEGSGDRQGAETGEGVETKSGNKGTMSDDSYPITAAEHVKKAVTAYPRGAGKGGKSKGDIRRHIVSRAKAVGGLQHVPNHWPEKHAGGGSKDLGLDVETKAAPVMPGSVEALQQQIIDALQDAMLPDEDGDASTGDDSGSAVVVIEATFGDRVVCTVIDTSDPSGLDSQSYEVPYTVEDDETVTLGVPQPVDLVLGAEPDTDDASGGDEGEAPDVLAAGDLSGSAPLSAMAGQVKSLAAMLEHKHDPAADEAPDDVKQGGADDGEKKPARKRTRLPARAAAHLDAAHRHLTAALAVAGLPPYQAAADTEPDTSTSTAAADEKDTAGAGTKSVVIDEAELLDAQRLFL